MVLDEKMLKHNSFAFLLLEDFIQNIFLIIKGL